VEGRRRFPEGITIGANARIDPDVMPEDFEETWPRAG
jgi:hypothetical protein